MLAVTFRFGMGVDLADRQVFELGIECFREMRGRIGGAQMHRIATACQLDGQCGSQRCLADTALAHQHDKAMSVHGNLVDQRRKVRRSQRSRRCLRGMGWVNLGHGIVRRTQQLAQRGHTHQIE